MKRKWEKWLRSPHGQGVAERLAGGGAPTIEEMKRFSTYSYAHRSSYSCVGRKGGGKSYGALQIPYMLGKFVFPAMGYEGWTGLTIAQAKAKNAPLCTELREHWQALNVQEEQPSGRDLVKKKWDDQLYFFGAGLLHCRYFAPEPRRSPTGGDGLRVDDVLPCWLDGA